MLAINYFYVNHRSNEILHEFLSQIHTLLFLHIIYDSLFTSFRRFLACASHRSSAAAPSSYPSLISATSAFVANFYHLLVSVRGKYCAKYFITQF